MTDIHTLFDPQVSSVTVSTLQRTPDVPDSAIVDGVEKWTAQLVASTEERRRRVSEALDEGERSGLGQYFTPVAVAHFLASLFDLKPGPATLLDPGAGVGSLTSAFVARWTEFAKGPLAVVAAE